MKRSYCSVLVLILSLIMAMSMSVSVFADDESTIADGVYDATAEGAYTIAKPDGSTVSNPLLCKKVFVEDGEAVGVFESASKNLSHVFLGDINVDSSEGELTNLYDPENENLGEDVYETSVVGEGRRVALPIELDEDMIIANRTKAGKNFRWVKYTIHIDSSKLSEIESPAEKALEITNNIEMQKFESAILIVTETVDGTEYAMDIKMGSNAYDIVKTEDGEEIEIDDDKIFQDVPVTVGENMVVKFHATKSGKWFKREMTVDLEAETVTFDEHETVIDSVFKKDDTEEQVKEKARANATPELVNDLIEVIYQTKKYEMTDIYCIAAGAAWNALTDEQKEQVEESDYFALNTGSATADNPRNTAPDKENEILVVSFGTSFNDSRNMDIGGIEHALEDKNPDWSVRRAFTAQIIINHIYARDGIKIDNVEDALKKAKESNVKNLLVQPTHLMHGHEYDELVEALNKVKDDFESVAIAEPLLGEVGADATTLNKDKEAVAKAVVAKAVESSEYDSLEAAEEAKAAFVFMGHGTSHDAAITYSQMQAQMKELGYNNVFIGTVEGNPEATALPQVKHAVEAAGYEKVILRPLMVVAGDHANNDMADENEGSGSWFAGFAYGGEFEVEGSDHPVDIGEGFGRQNVECQIAGLGRISDVWDIYVSHAADVNYTKVNEAKETALTTLAKYEADSLNDDEKAALAEALADAKTAIENATSVTDAENAKKDAVAALDALLYAESEDVNVYYDKEGKETILGMFRVMKYRSSIVAQKNGKLLVTITNKPMTTQHNKMAFVAGDKTEEEKEAAAIPAEKKGPDAENKYQSTYVFEVDPADVDKDLFISLNTTGSSGTAWGTNATYRIKVHNTQYVQDQITEAKRLKKQADDAAMIKKVKAGKIKSFKVKAGKKKATFKWKKNTTFAGYELKYKVGKKTKTVKIKSAKTVKKVIKKLKKGKKVSGKIRGYKKINGKTYYGKWVKSKTVKVK